MTTPHDLLEQCVRDQAESWRRGERIPIETYIRTHAELSGDDARMDLVYAEYLLRESEGESVQETEYRARFPDLQERIAALFQLHYRLSPPAPKVEPREAPTDAPLKTPRFAEYALVGRGGLGTVWRARDLDLDRTVAIKLLHPHAAEFGGAVRLRKEAGAIARLHHPNIVQIYDVGEEDGQPYLVLEYVAGGTLADRLQQGVLPTTDVVRLIRDVAIALQSAHDHQVIHRDLKPGNILLEPGKELIPKIADFGLAKQLDDASLSQSGAMVGTAYYMAPEQTGVGPVGPPADVYALGAILYECLTNRPPYLGDSPLAVLALAAKADPVLPSRLRPGISPDLEAVVIKCLQVEPERRYATARELADDLDRVLTNRPTVARPSTVFDRMAKWVRRNPQPAAYAGVALLTAAIGLAVVIWQWQQAVVARTNLQNSLDAEALQRRATERSLYATAISQAAMNWDLGDIAKAHEQLTLALPQPGQEDYRGWEWHYLQRLFHGERQIIPCEHWCNAIVRRAPRQFALAIGTPKMNAYESGDGTGRAARLELGATELTPPGDRPGAVLAVAVDTESGATVWGIRGQRIVLRDRAETILREWTITADVACLGFLDAGRRVVVGDEYGTLRVFDRDATDPLHTISIWQELRVVFAISPDRKMLLIAGGVNKAKLFSLPDMNPVGELSPMLGRIPSVTFNRDGTLAATGHSDGTLVLWNAATRQEVLRFKAHAGPIAAVAFHPVDPLVATAGSDGAVHFWRQSSGQLTATFRGHLAALRCLAFAEDGQSLLTGGQDGTVRVWDSGQNPRGRLLAFNTRFNAVGIETGAAGLTLRAASLSGLVRTWRLAAGTSPVTQELSLPLVARRSYPVAYMTFLQNALRLAGLPKDEKEAVAIWDPETGAEIERFRCAGEVITLNTDSQGRWLAVAARAESAKCQIILREPGVANEPIVYSLSEESVRAVSVSHDGRALAVIGDLNPATDTRALWLMGNDHPPRIIGRVQRSRGAIAFSPDGRLLAVNNETRIDLYDAATGELLRSTGAVGAHTCLTFSPDGKRIAAVGYDGVVAFVDVVTGKVIFQLRGLGPGRPDDMAADARVMFTADGRTLVSTNWDGSINVWNGPR